MCVRSFASSKRLGLGRSCSCLAVTALFTVGCGCRTDTLDSGTGVALLRVLRKSITRGKRGDDESRTRTPALERGDSYYRPGVVVRAAHDEKDFPMVCQSAGMDPGRLRGQLGRMRRNGPGLSNQPASHGTLGSPPRRTS